MSGTPLLELDALSVAFRSRAGDVPAVTDFSLSIRPGEAVGLVGESGCGKSTVALAVMRDLGQSGRISGGTVRWRGRDMGEMSAAELRAIRGRDIAMIYQEPMAALNPAIRVGRQLMEVPMLHEGISRVEARTRALAMIGDVKLPDAGRIFDAYPHQLSGGQQQRIVIAMALMSNPALLILDEPTTALDVTVEAAVVELLRALGRKYQTAMLFISHNLGLVLDTCDRICVMYAGEAVETGDTAHVFGHMRHPYTQALFRSIPLPATDRTTRPLVTIPGICPPPQHRPTGCNFAPRCAYARPGLCDQAPVPMTPIAESHRHLTRCLRHEEIDWSTPPTPEPRPPSPAPGPVVLSGSNLRKYYEVAKGALFGGKPQKVKANEAISFDARRGETLAIVGESGCGKSTLAKLILGLETATDGTLRFRDSEIGTTPVEERATATVADIQMVFQNPFDTLNPSMRVGRQITRALELFGHGNSSAERHAEMLRLLDLVRLPREYAGRTPRQLSGGQKQRVGIARAFAGGAQVVVADEPVSALDVSVQAAVSDLLIDIQRDRGTTLIFISHDLSIVRYLSDRVMVMYLGHVVEEGTTAQVFAPPYHPYTEALLAAVPIADPGIERRKVVLDGDVPSALSPPPGCPFQTRCNWRSEVPGSLCETDLPPLREMTEGHRIRCHLAEDILARMEPVISPAED